MTGAKFINKAHLQALSLHVFTAEHNSANQSVVDRVTSCAKMFRDRETRQVLLCFEGARQNVVLVYALFNVHGRATATDGG